jgi:hypothetical protein
VGEREGKGVVGNVGIGACGGEREKGGGQREIVCVCVRERERERDTWQRSAPQHSTAQHQQELSARTPLLQQQPDARGEMLERRQHQRRLARVKHVGGEALVDGGGDGGGREFLEEEAEDLN